MSGGCADETPAHARDHTRNGLRVFPPQRFTGQDHDTGIDVVGMHTGSIISIIDDGAETGLVDALLALIGRERYRRLKQRLARDDKEAAGKILTETRHIEAREKNLRAR